LNWVRLEGADSCAPAASVARRVEDRVKRLVFASVDEADVFVDGYVRRAPKGGWDVQLAVSTRNGRVWGRRDIHFDGEDCSLIDDGVALVIAVTIDPNRDPSDIGIPLDEDTAGSLDQLFGAEPVDPDLASLPTPVGREAEAKPVAAETSPEPSAADDRELATPPSWGVRFEVAGVAGAGQLPGASFGLAAHLQIEPPDAWPFELSAVVLQPRTAAATGESDGRGTFNLMLASVATCPWSPLPVFELCGGAELGVLHLATRGFAESQPPSSAVVANAILAGTLHASLFRGFALRFGAVLALPLVQHRYSFRASDATNGQLYRMSQAAGRLEIGVGYRF
jgi:hypothetical protein